MSLVSSIKKVGSDIIFGFKDGVSLNPKNGRTNGLTVPKGQVGEYLAFTNRNVTTSAGGYVANATALATLTPGVWLIKFVVFWNVAAGSNDVAYGHITSNSANDATGILFSNAGHKVLTATVANAVAISDTYYHNVAVDTPLFFKGFSEDSNFSMTGGGFAVRIA